MTLRIRNQQSGSVNAGTGICAYGDSASAAVLFVRATDAEAVAALTYAFQLHQAPVVKLERTVPDLDRTAGDCVIRDDGILMTLQAVDPAEWNNGSGMLGLNLELFWGQTSSTWRQIAQVTGCVWACLLAEEQYQRAVFFEDELRRVDVAKVPAAPVLKLDTIDGQ